MAGKGEQQSDGALIRLPGGTLAADQLEALAHAAAEHGGSLQLPGFGSEHTIVSSPLSGRVGGLVDVRPWVTDLNDALGADPVPDGFWFSVDDGSADVSGLAAPVGIHALDDGTVALLSAGVDTGVRLEPTKVVSTLLDQSRLDRLSPTAEPGRTWPVRTRGPIGWLPQSDGRITLGAGVPDGVLPSRTAEYLAAIGAPIVVTPWKSLLVCDLSEEVADISLRVLAPLGLIFDADAA